MSKTKLRICKNCDRDISMRPLKTIFCSPKCEKSFKFNSISGKISREVRLLDIYKNAKCPYCGIYLNKLNRTIEHLIPHKNNLDIALNINNIIYCCKSCNSSKRDSDLIDFCKKKRYLPKKSIIDRYNALKLKFL